MTRSSQRAFTARRATQPQRAASTPAEITPVAPVPTTTLAALESDGWELLFSPVLQRYYMRHSANIWSTLLYSLPAEAMHAAATLQARAAMTMERRAATVAELRRAIRGNDDAS